MAAKKKRIKKKKVNKMTSVKLVKKLRSLRNDPSLYRKHIEERLFTLIGCIPVE